MNEPVPGRLWYTDIDGAIKTIPVLITDVSDFDGESYTVVVRTTGRPKTLKKDTDMRN